jgi:hypothetical protein
MRTVAIGIVVVVVLALGLVVGIAQLTDKGSANNPTDPSVDVVLNSLDKVNGKRITVEGTVKVRMAPWIVSVGSSDASQVGLVVVARRRIPAEVGQAAHIVVTGIASPFSLGDFRRHHPGMSTAEIEKTALVDLDGQPALLDARVTARRPTS